jgi:hypothetical protein
MKVITGGAVVTHKFGGYIVYSAGQLTKQTPFNENWSFAQAKHVSLVSEQS